MKKNIVLASDDNYVEHCAVTVLSILKNNTEVCFYLLYEKLSEDNINKLVQLAIDNGGQLVCLKVDERQLEGFPMSPMASDHISITTYLRLFAERLLPNSISRVLYLDCDMVVVGDLSPLFDMNMDNNAIAAVYQYDKWALDNNSFGRLMYSEEEGYFNAGTLLINLDYWRRNGVTNRLFSFIREHRDRIISHDQDVLNAVLYKENAPFNPEWNYLPFFMDKDFKHYHFTKKVSYTDTNWIEFNPIVIHYVSKPKPWEYGCKSPLKKYYYQYLFMLPWETKMPTFNVKEWYKNIFIPFCVRIKHLLYGHKL